MDELFSGKEIKPEPIHRKGFCDYWNTRKNRFCMCRNSRDSRFCRFHSDIGITSQNIFPNIELEERYDKFEKSDECPVCYEKWNINDTRPLECGHWVHINCVCKSFTAECPICRTKLTKLTSKQINRINSNKAIYDIGVARDNNTEIMLAQILNNLFVSDTIDSEELNIGDLILNDILAIGTDRDGNLYFYIQE